MAKRIAILGSIVVILGGLPSAFYWWPSPTKAEYIKVKHLTIDHHVRWLLVDMNAAEQAMQNAKTNDNKLYWKRKVNTIQIQLNQLIKEDIKKWSVFLDWLFLLCFILAHKIASQIRPIGSEPWVFCLLGCQKNFLYFLFH